MSTWDTGLTVRVIVTVADERAILRCTENHDEDGQPQPDERGSGGWRNSYYDLRRREDVLDHWTYNAVVNGVRDASELDGWADLERGVVVMSIEGTDDGWATDVSAV